MQLFIFAAAIALLLMSPSAFAAQLGDPAAPLAIKEWIKGSPVDVKDGKNIYVVEFWATWCPPCRASIPRLTEMQTKLKDKGVVLIGITRETPEEVKPFVEKMGKQMDYIVAIDSEDKTSAGYMGAYNQQAIPVAFIVNKEGKVIWLGNPLDGLDGVLESILAGKYDMKAAAAIVELKMALTEYQRTMSLDPAKAHEVGRKVLAKLGNDIDELTAFAIQVVDCPPSKRNFDLAEEALAIAEKAAKGKDPRLLGSRSVVLFHSGKQSEAIAMAKEAAGLAAAGEEKRRYEQFVTAMESIIKQQAATSDKK